ncbi:diaminopimelate decarboxylase family protein [Mycobacterium parmense]|uniref:Diaminopimelate decarboxylase n=1 Tax=Mycobacterium parmense TaxID=185642 RepID=A0A7I7Z007_9MYCO|nr:diaminopimelate decarboxylase [Mycobacterium parmense]MCV7352895.1 diaminopimelate decarboxylase [Mycobacterium parmense]ORW55483.1 diaminopimelate decarboxylase [Mycobacterium parmense]BBZ46907.1 diaminopimelate decarboxylase [Mycobacterium parmense]
MTVFEVLPAPRHASGAHLDRSTWPLSAEVDDLGRLCVGGVAATKIAAEFGTPAHLVDETDFRARIGCYRAALPKADLIYAGKALLSVAVAGWAADAGAGVSVCSAGELATALAADVPPSRIVLHGNAKTAGELHDAVAAGVGWVVVDSPSEIALLAGWVRSRQRVLIRAIPDTDGAGAPTQTFGFALTGGHAAGAVKRVLDQPWLDPVGLHCQLGTLVADAGAYGAAIGQLVAVMAEVRDRHDVVLTQLNLGGGRALSSTYGDAEPQLRALGGVVDTALATACAEHDFPRPRVVFEVGRGIAAHAGITLYRVIAVKHQPGGGIFVAVDGTDQAADDAEHAVALANRPRSCPTARVTVVGRNGETGGAIARDVPVPADVRPGDLLAVAGTGAYHHSIASSRSLVGRPPLVAVAGGRSRELVRRETVADLLGRDCGWSGRESGGR